jgi:hypothetical protein
MGETIRVVHEERVQITPQQKWSAQLQKYFEVPYLHYETRSQSWYDLKHDFVQFVHNSANVVFVDSWLPGNACGSPRIGPMAHALPSQPQSSPITTNIPNYKQTTPFWMSLMYARLTLPETFVSDTPHRPYI